MHSLALNLRHTLAILEGLHQVLDAHLEIQALLRGDAAVAIETMHGLVDLLFQNILVEQHHDYVVEVVPGTGVEQDANDIAEVVQLMLGEELVVQVEAAENHVHLCHVVVVPREEWVVQCRKLWTRGIEQPQLVLPSRAVNVWQQFFEKFEVALAVEDDDGDVMAIFGWTDETRNVLRDDVLEQCRLARSRHAEHDALHHAHLVGPQPRLFVHVVSKQHGVLVPGGFDCALVLARRDDERRALPALSLLGELAQNRHRNRGGNDEQVERGFHKLFFANVIPGDSQVQRECN
jgi:hypothetical protein